MALFSRDSENTQPEQAKDTSQSSTVQASQSVAENRIAPARQAVSVRQSYLGRDSKVEGKLSFEQPARVDGQMDGEILASDLIIGESAVVMAQIKAVSVKVGGAIKGEIIASQRIEILASAKVSGKITSPILIMHEGAAFEGRCAMQPEKVHAAGKSTRA